MWEDKKRLAVGLDQVLGHADGTVDLLPGPEGTQELVLHLVDLHDTYDFECAAAVANAEHEPPAGSVGESGNRLVRSPGRRVTRLLALDIGPFILLQGGRSTHSASIAVIYH